MELFAGGRLSETVALRLDQGDDVLESITAAARQLDLHTGVVLSGIGTLDRARMHHITHTGYPPKDAIVEYEGPIELLSIDGLIADYTPHLHTCISIKERTYMGHLEPGCRVLYLAEIAVARLEGVRLCRRLNENTRVSQLQQEDQGPR
jgi:predicted DNA-binding protein with PD1-like motif